MSEVNTNNNNESEVVCQALELGADSIAPGDGPADRAIALLNLLDSAAHFRSLGAAWEGDDSPDG